MNVDLDSHQMAALRELKDGKILRGGVGSGKSRVSLAYFVTQVCAGSVKFNGIGEVKAMANPTDIYIITTANKRDKLEWEEEAASFGLSRVREDSFGWVKVTVDSWNNIGKYKDVKNAFFVFDEQRLVGSGAWVKAFLLIAASNQWIMLSATPGDTWMDYIPVFIANGFYRNRTEFIRRHVVYNNFSRFPKVDHYVEERRLHRLRKMVLVEVDFKRHTKRHIKTVLVEYDRALMDRVLKDRWHVFEERPIKDVGELFLIMRKVVNSDASRIRALDKILQDHPRVIVFYNFNYELDALRAFAGEIGIPNAEWNGHRHETIPDTDKWLYIVQYTAGAEGWNCTSTDVVVFYSLNYSYKINEQARGRIDRMNTPFVDLFYYVFRSNSKIDNAIWRAITLKKNFNERKLHERLWPVSGLQSEGQGTASPIAA